MTIIQEEDYTLKIIQGDTGTFEIDSIPTDKNYHVYCQVRDRNRRPVGTQLMEDSGGNDKVTFKVTTALSDRLRVPRCRTFEPYTYGIKIFDPETEEEITYQRNGEIGKAYRLIVYPKQAEGPGPDISNDTSGETKNLVTRTDLEDALENYATLDDLGQIEGMRYRDLY